MKKIISLLLTASLAFAVTACGSSQSGAASSTASAESSTVTTEETATVDEAAEVSWPEKNVKIIVGFGAGGDTDLAARILADALSKKTGVSVIVENLAGGTGVVGRTEMLTSDDNGYTLMFDQPGSPITQVLMGNTSYELDKAGTPICTIATSALSLCVASNNSKGIENLDDFAEYAKAHPNELSYAIPGQFTSAHLAALTAFKTLGIEVQSVPTDSSATCVTETLGNHVDAMIVPYSAAQQYVDSGDMTLIALSAPSSFASEDDPQFADYDIAEYETWYSLWGSMAVTPEVAQQISDTVGEIMQDESVVEALKELKIDPGFQDYTETQEMVTKYQEIIKNALAAGGVS